MLLDATRRIYRGDFRDLVSRSISALGFLIFRVRVRFVYARANPNLCPPLRSRRGRTRQGHPGGPAGHAETTTTTKDANTGGGAVGGGPSGEGGARAAADCGGPGQRGLRPGTVCLCGNLPAGRVGVASLEIETWVYSFLRERAAVGLVSVGFALARSVFAAIYLRDVEG